MMVSKMIDFDSCQNGLLRKLLFFNGQQKMMMMFASQPNFLGAFFCTLHTQNGLIKAHNNVHGQNTKKILRHTEHSSLKIPFNNVKGPIFELNLDVNFLSRFSRFMFF